MMRDVVRERRSRNRDEVTRGHVNVRQLIVLFVLVTVPGETVLCTLMKDFQWRGV